MNLENVCHDIYCSPAAWQSSDHTHVLAGSSSTPGSTYWQSRPDTPPVKDTGQVRRRAHQHMTGCLSRRREGGRDLATGATVMPPPGEGELAGTDHAHGGPQVWDPDRSL